MFIEVICHLNFSFLVLPPLPHRMSVHATASKYRGSHSKYRIHLLSYRSRCILMSYTDHSVQPRLKSNTPNNLCGEQTHLNTMDGRQGPKPYGTRDIYSIDLFNIYLCYCMFVLSYGPIVFERNCLRTYYN